MKNISLRLDLFNLHKSEFKNSRNYNNNFKIRDLNRKIFQLNKTFTSSTKIMLQFSIILILFISQMKCISMNVVKLPSLYWSTSNRLFTDLISSVPNYYLKLNAHIGDSIDLVCPRSGPNDNLYEYSVIYKVSSKYEFDNCMVNPNNYETVPILKCDKLSSVNSIKFTIYFVKFSPVPNALEFEENKEYYFLSTSSGTKEGISQQSGGLCSKFNMKFSIKINSNSNSSLLSKLMRSKDLNSSENDEDSREKNNLKDMKNIRNEQEIETDNIIDKNAEQDIDDQRSQPQVSKLNLVVSSNSNSIFNNNFVLSIILIISLFNLY